MKTYVGIDFGACNLKAAKLAAQGKRVQIIKLNKDAGETGVAPNVILYDKVKDALEIKVGKPAKNSPDRDNKVWQIKTKLAQRDWKKYIENLGEEVTAVRVVEDTLNWVWQTIIKKESKEQEWDVAITVPVSFSEVQKNVMRQAALKVGIPVKAVVTEPFAAMFSLEDELDDVDEAVYLIFDFGGSTLDLSLFRLERDDDNLEVTELAAGGLNYGGIDIDKGILEDIFKVNCPDTVNKILAGDSDGRLKNDLMDLISKMKSDLFVEDADEEVTDYATGKSGELYELKLTQDDVIKMLDNAKIKAGIVAKLDEMFDDAGIDKDEVTSVKLFGGTSAIKYFWEMLTEYFGEEIFDCNDFEFEAEDSYMGVAIGAAKYRMLSDAAKSTVTIKNVVPYSLGLAKGNEFKRYIKRNELAGFELPYKPLMVEELKRSGWRVAVYQSFGNELELPLDGGEAVFMTNVELDEKLYTVEDAILFKMKMGEDGRLNMKFFEQRLKDGEPEIVLVEEKFMRIGE